MNRRHFFRNLVLGAAALPVIAKALAASKPSIVRYGEPRLWVRPPGNQTIFMCSNPSGKWSHNPAWDHAQYDVRFETAIGQPAWFDGHKWRVIDNRTNQWVTL